MTAVDADRAVVCLDADALIYAASAHHPLGSRILALFEASNDYRLVGSALLLPEALTQPRDEQEAAQLEALFSQIEIWPITQTIGRLAVWMGSRYRLDAMGATHLACAVDGGADVFLTNNRKEFAAAAIGEIDVVYPDELPADL